jgi:tyrosine ammonia-lyase
VRIEDLVAVAQGTRRIELSADATQAIRSSRELLEHLVSQRRLIYGVTTGYGPLAGEYIEPGRCDELQRNLVYHLASGVGPAFDPVTSRAIWAARIVNLAQGCSGARLDLVRQLCEAINAGLVPRIPSQGTVGASGDLTPLAHLALALMGEGEFSAPAQTARGVRRPRACQDAGENTQATEGSGMSAVTPAAITPDTGVRWEPAAAVLRRHGFPALSLSHKEGLALVNGTSAMTAIAALNQERLERAWEWLVLLSLLNAELFGARPEPFSEHWGALRPHPGQVSVLAWWQRLAASSARWRSAARRLPAQPGREGIHAAQAIPQDPYTIRCAPQLLGAVWDVLTWHRRVVETELNSVTDNPVFLPGERWGGAGEAQEPENGCGQVLHGGNFFGQSVAFASDALLSPVIQMAVLAERQLARLTDVRQSGGFPPFLTGGRPGIDSGFMGAQVTATALLAEMRTLAVPAGCQSIATNGNNQDINPLGTVGARRIAHLTGELYGVLAITLLAMVQAYDLAGGPAAGFSEASQWLARQVRLRWPFLSGDRPLSAEIEEARDWLKNASAYPIRELTVEARPPRRSQSL